MRYFYFFLGFFLIVSCKTKTEAVRASDDIMKTTAATCPEKGDCHIQVYKKKELHLAQDEFGIPYLEIREGKNYVVEYSFTRMAPAGVADGNYRETLHFEIPESTASLNLKDGDLQDVNLIYGRFCFCPDSGYFQVKNGELSLKNSNRTIDFSLRFKIPEVRQVVSHIEEKAVIE